MSANNILFSSPQLGLPPRLQRPICSFSLSNKWPHTRSLPTCEAKANERLCRGKG